MKRIVSLLVVSALALVMVGCSGNSNEDYDANKIIQKQPGSGPPPLAKPTDAPAKP